jgi:IS5 family transposase
VFAVVKRRWGFTKVRYRGLAKNATRAFTARALLKFSVPSYSTG